jgi:4-amino-4-deoxy-L-arabinose transferase-like glycosyltransferase
VPADRTDVTRRRVLAFWLLLAAAWLTTGAIRPLLEPDEGRYAEIPREMWLSGDWVTPHLNGLAYFEKPPLQYWATAVSYTLFGLHEWTARLWAVALSLLAMPLVHAVASRLHGSREAGLAAVVVLAVSPYYVLAGQLNTLDGAFSTLLLAAAFALVLGQRESDAARRRPLLLAAWAALALAVLSKGIVAPLLAGGTLVAYSLMMRDFSPWRRMHWLPGLVAFAMIVVPWFWLISARNPDFLYFFFVHEHFARFLTTVHDRAAPWWYYGPIALLAILPWLRAIPGAVGAGRANVDTATGFRPAVFLGLWLAVVIVFFSLSGSKLANYILPCMPAAAVLLGPQLLREPRHVSTAAATTVILVLVTAAGLCVVAPRRAADGELPLALAIWAAVGVAVALAAWFWSRRPAEGGGDPIGWAPLAVGAVLAWQSVLMSYTFMPPLRTAKGLVAQVSHYVGPETRIYSVRQYRQTVPVYLGRTMQLAAYSGEFEFGLAHADAGRIPTLEAFAAVWQHDTDAVAFMSPGAQAELATRGLPGRVVASDGRSVVMVRQ